MTTVCTTRHSRARNRTELLIIIAQEWQQHINDQRSSQLGSVTSESVKPRESGVGGPRHDDHRTARMQALGAGAGQAGRTAKQSEQMKWAGPWAGRRLSPATERSRLQMRAGKGLQGALAACPLVHRRSLPHRIVRPPSTSGPPLGLTWPWPVVLESGQAVDHNQLQPQERAT